jgi:hypothetical protein
MSRPAADRDTLGRQSVRRKLDLRELDAEWIVLDPSDRSMPFTHDRKVTVIARRRDARSSCGLRGVSSGADA